MRIITHAAQEAVGDARRAARAARDLSDPIILARHGQNRGRPFDDLRQRLWRIKIQAKNKAEPVAQRGGEKPGPGRGSNQREWLQREFHRPRRGSLTDHNVDLVILHGGIEHFLNNMVQPVNLIDK